MTMPIAAPELDLLSLEKLREEELDEARAIQSGMLPTQPLRIGGITISHEFQLAALVGGDYLDYFALPDGMIGMYVGDVSGKGFPAAMYAALAVGTLRAYTNGTASGPGDGPLEQKAAASRHTRQIYRHPVRPARSHHGAVAYLQRRNVRAYVAARRRMWVLQVAGIPRGLFPEINYDHLTLQLEPGDSLLFYTDGLTDARNCHEAEFEAAGLQQVCGSHAGNSPLELLGRIFSTIQKWATARNSTI
jgi:phosphoserine phosphatase RsbU/P